MSPINGVGQDTFSFKLGNLISTTSQKIQEQQTDTATPVQAAAVQARSEVETAKIAYGNTVTALENGQQPTGQTGHALDPARVAALLDF
ncbi:hypothetical protein [Halodesulfovibrio aestuarii]|uniref:Uncharacterized protein n=1 Tax=Halodesulfovibrio aestuarii TaxID=126333 RepID=A0A8G2FBJ0_9BACT|nr:hypothetical protein [Halodesulfovibrio aestuarii]SHJ38895.1 hypothetical protein SAMN05660830_02325 [Halodesulfovibrio aestuarii]